RRGLGELEGVAREVGVADDLVPLVVVAEDHEALADRLLGRDDALLRLRGRRGLHLLGQRDLERHRTLLVDYSGRGPVHVRVCVDCGEEYRPEIEVCADCGGTLRDADDRPEPDTLLSRSSSAPDSDLASPPDLTGHRAVYQTREPRDLAKAAESLRDAGFAFRIVEKRLENDERRSALVLFVRDEDESSALRLLAPLHGPDAVAYVEREEAQVADDETRCPACETAVPKGARECPECGLGLSGEGEPGENG